ncbi:ORC-CDC6 family AAA ATPase [Mycolicibacterium baixiangningiae]|uniref:ORC-CDC6 family AAA ATPase n=1 Tax=Mycolicibacterium baixiangningiae TaxID=2761578 RepID=UPI0018D130AF|nr:hypothetical protein [Mycolicibacterium baixiangningiae]
MTASPSSRIASPFGDDRWENQYGRHFFYLNTNEYKALIGNDRHSFVIGHRGTGKTTILKALDWEERLTNPSLIRALANDDPFEDGVVGCFMNLRVVALQVFDLWLRDQTDASKHLIFSSYLRLSWIELATQAVSRILAGRQGFNLEIETQILERCGHALRQWLEPVPCEILPNIRTDIVSLNKVESIASCIRDYIWNAANLELMTPANVATTLNLHRLLEATNRIFKALADLLTAIEPRRQWTFRMCMDEGEHLSREAALSIRSLVRECESPLIMVVAALHNLGVDTIRPTVNLATEDRRVIDLDKRSRNDFVILFSGILEERVLQWMGESVSVDLELLLGAPSLNELLIRTETENPALKAIRSKWGRTLRDDPESLQKTASGPIYDFMLEHDWIRPLSDGPGRRLRASSGYRKYSTQAYFAILRNAGLTTPFYAGIGIVMGLPDNSIRDALRFIDGCFLTYRAAAAEYVEPGQAVRSFLRRTVPYAEQNRALYEVGQRKIDSDMPSRIEAERDNAGRLVEFFGLLAHLLTFSGDKHESCRFSVRLPNGDSSEVDHAKASLFVDAVRMCSREGYMRIDRDSVSDGEISFRMHRSLAKFYGFTFRRPSYTTAVPWEIVEEVWVTPSHQSMRRLAERVIARRKVHRGPRRNDPRRQDGDEGTQFTLFDDGDG